MKLDTIWCKYAASGDSHYLKEIPLTKGFKGFKRLGHRHRSWNNETTVYLFPFNGTWVVERPVVWHANKKTRLKGTKNLPRQFFPKTISLQLNRFSLAPCETTRLIYLPVVESSPTHAKGVYETIEVVRTWNFSSNSKKTVESRKKKPLKINLANQILFPRCLS